MPAIRRVAAWAALAMVVVVGWASPASAHAILLRTQPSPQTTVKQAPASIRLEFSEPVEVAFGALRVFDVDGHRVDRGSIRRAHGDRHVIVGSPHLKDGSYTVTWRVASADGHSVHGGFAFYVGAPSTISAVAIPADQGPGRLVGWGFGVIRFAWLAAMLSLVGLVVVRKWVWTPALRAAGLSDSPTAALFRRRFARALPGAWGLLALSGASSIVFQGASVSGLGLNSSVRPVVISEVLRTAYGRYWLVSIALTFLAAVPVIALVRKPGLLGVSAAGWIGALGVAVAGLCLVTALNGHARTEAHPLIGVPSLAAHLLAVAVWVGGLAALVVLGGAGWRSLPPEERGPLLRQLLPRFSRLAAIAVAVVVASGVVNALISLASVSDLWRTTYGQVLAGKIVLLVVALSLAARHRWTLPRRLAGSAGAAPVARGFQRSAAAEALVLGVTVALAAVLVGLVPGRSLALAARGPVNQEHRAGAYTVQLFIDPTRLGANQVHVTFVDAKGLGATEVANASVALGWEGAGLRRLDARLISAGHFVADTVLPGPGRYRLTVASPTISSAPTTTFHFRLRGKASADHKPKETGHAR